MTKNADAKGWFYISMTILSPILVNYAGPRLYEVLHHHRNEQMMQSITERQRAVRLLLAGDDVHLNELFEHYSYVGKETARYIYYTRGVPSIPLEDLEQQGYLVLLLLLHKIEGSEMDGLGDVNHHDDYDDCLGLRPWLITSVRGRLKNFITEGGLIRVKKNIFEKDVIERYGERKPIEVISDTGVETGGEEFTGPDSIPTKADRPEDGAILNECLEALHLTYLEKHILRMRQQGHILDDIAKILGKDKATISRKLKGIGDRWLSANF